jgi:hypothetical protein
MKRHTAAVVHDDLHNVWFPTCLRGCCRENTPFADYTQCLKYARHLVAEAEERDYRDAMSHHIDPAWTEWGSPRSTS